MPVLSLIGPSPRPLPDPTAAARTPPPPPRRAAHRTSTGCMTSACRCPCPAARGRTSPHRQRGDACRRAHPVPSSPRPAGVHAKQLRGVAARRSSASASRRSPRAPPWSATSRGRAPPPPRPGSCRTRPAPPSAPQRRASSPPREGVPSTAGGSRGSLFRGSQGALAVARQPGDRLAADLDVHAAGQQRSAGRDQALDLRRQPARPCGTRNGTWRKGRRCCTGTRCAAGCPRRSLDPPVVLLKVLHHCRSGHRTTRPAGRSILRTRGGIVSPASPGGFGVPFR